MMNMDCPCCGFIGLEMGKTCSVCGYEENKMPLHTAQWHRLTTGNCEGKRGEISRLNLQNMSRSSVFFYEKARSDRVLLVRQCSEIHDMFLDMRILSCDGFVFHDSVRGLCQQNQCGAYGKNWMCPPAIGSMDECKRKLAHFQYALLVQTAGQLEDAFDYPNMLKAEKRHNRHLKQATAKVKKDFPHATMLGAGGCRICKGCSYPGAPCRFPDEAYYSMEGMGLLVSEMCQSVGMPCHYGKNTVTYMGCIMI